MTGPVALSITTDDGEEMVIVQLLDCDGEETEEIDKAHIAVCQMSDGQLVPFEITYREEVTLH